MEVEVIRTAGIDFDPATGWSIRVERRKDQGVVGESHIIHVVSRHRAVASFDGDSEVSRKAGFQQLRVSERR